ncbi:2-amino-4-deoxychorismate dehydrogenase [Halioglobus japonicus]|nr:2-amino-4-deoxychorismate dehydrogenase [Halioglobus japonicus]
MKILVINASPNREKGGSHTTLQFIEKALCAENDTVDIETLYLADLNQPYCDGCLSCLKEGGQTCPVLDKVAPVEAAIRSADGLIFAAPVHSFNIGAMGKTMIDLLVKEIHRPSFFGKKAVVVATAMGGGQQGVLKYMRNTLALWGVDVVAKVGSSSAQLGKPHYDQKMEVVANSAARALLSSIANNTSPRPQLIDLISFQIMRIAILNSSDSSPLDHQYWSERGWLQADYFSNDNINPMKNILAKMIGKLIGRQIRKDNSKPIYIG